MRTPSPDVRSGAPTTTPLWRIQPVAVLGDSRWQGRRVWAEVIVRAPSAAFARVAAGKLDAPAARRRLGNETHCFRSGFADEKLYWVRRVGPTEAAAYEDVEPADGVIVAVPLSNDTEGAAHRQQPEQVHSESNGTDLTMPRSRRMAPLV